MSQHLIFVQYYGHLIQFTMSHSKSLFLNLPVNPHISIYSNPPYFFLQLPEQASDFAPLTLVDPTFSVYEDESQ